LNYFELPQDKRGRRRRLIQIKFGAFVELRQSGPFKHWDSEGRRDIAALDGIERSANSHVDPDQFQPAARA
jgi:hypothetical protein